MTTNNQTAKEIGDAAFEMALRNIQEKREYSGEIEAPADASAETIRLARASNISLRLVLDD